jgi:oligopeptidase B
LIDFVFCFWFVLFADFVGIEYYLDHRGANFYIVTNSDGAYNYKILMVDDNALFELAQWEVAVEHNDDVKIEDIDLFEVQDIIYIIYIFGFSLS